MVNSNLEASQAQRSEDETPPLKRSCRFSAKDPIDQALYGTEGDFLKNVFADAGSNFRGRGHEGHKRDKREMSDRLQGEKEGLKGRLYRGRDTSPEYRAAIYAVLLQFQS